MEFYRKVTKRQFSNGKPMANMAIYNEQARKLREEREIAKESAAIEAENTAKLNRWAREQSSANHVILEGFKRKTIQEVHKFVPLAIMNEFFSKLVISALPHDEEFIMEHADAITAFTRVYLHGIGGVQLLKERAAKTDSAILKRLATIVREDAEPIIKDKIDQINNAKSEDEVLTALNQGVESEKTDKVQDDIDSLNPDDIAEMVQNKVIDVVKDEKARQEEDASFREQLKAQAGEDEQEAPAAAPEEEQPAAEEPKAEEGIGTEAWGDIPDVNIDMTDYDKAHAPKQVMSENYKLAKYLLTPQILHENTLFYSIMHSVYSDLVKENKSATDKNPRYKAIKESALNMDAFDVYLESYKQEFGSVDKLELTTKEPLAEEATINPEDVMAEALIQYTILEAAVTLKLIAPTATEVHKVSTYNLSK